MKTNRHIDIYSVDKRLFDKISEYRLANGKYPKKLRISKTAFMYLWYCLVWKVPVMFEGHDVFHDWFASLPDKLHPGFFLGIPIELKPD